MLVYRSAEKSEHTAVMLADLQRLCDAITPYSVSLDRLCDLLLECGDIENAVLDAMERDDRADDLELPLRMLTVCAARTYVRAIASGVDGALPLVGDIRTALRAL